MSSSKEVFALRKEGSLDEAYAMALEIISTNPNDEWNIKALAWCLYDLTKRSVSQNDYTQAKSFVNRLEALQINESDDILFKAIEHAKVIANPEKKIILQAKENSKLGNHPEALLLFRQAILLFPDDIDLNTQFAWELQKEGKLIFEKDKVDVQEARKLLADYCKLKNERPSQLHSLFLRFADKITDKEEFNLVSFLKIWDLTNLREDDFVPFTKDGKTYPSIAEKIIQHGAKLILDKKQSQDVNYYLPFLDVAIKKFQDNIWLPYYKAKLLHLVNRNEEAIEFLIPVVKEKISDYWTWSLLAELIIESDIEIAISCYCKSLLCQGEEKFIANVRLKFAELLIQKELWSEAKFEIALTIRAKEQEETKISDKLLEYQQKEWYKNAVEIKNNYAFYNSHRQLAEEFIFNKLPWIDCCLGEVYTIPEKPDKPRRKLFIKLPTETIEVGISERKFNLSNKYKIGDALKVKGEYDNEKVFQIYLLENRISKEKWDLFEWNIGNVIHAITNANNKISGWRVSLTKGTQIKEGIIDMQNINSPFPIKEGMPIYVKFFQKTATFSFFSSEKEPRVNILSIKERPDGSLWDSFPESIGIIDHINKEKGIAHFIINKKTDSIIKLNQLKDNVEIGSKLLVRLKKVIKDKETYFTVLTCEITQKEPVENLLKLFQGNVELSGSVGFASDVFIESSLIAEYKIEDGSFVNGTAIINYNKKKGIWGWKAINIF